MRVYKMMTRVELAAFYNEIPYLDMTELNNKNIATVTKASRIEMRREFYDRTVAKAPLAVNLGLLHVGDTSFVTLTDFSCGGRMKPSVKVTNVHTFTDSNTNQVIPVPDWWRAKFDYNLQDHPPVFDPSSMSPNARTRSCLFTVPHSDTNAEGRTRCAAYMKYFLDAASIAAHQGFFDSITNSADIQNQPIRRINMLYTAASQWGDSLTTKTWEDVAKEEILCNVFRDEELLWAASLKYHKKETEM